MLYLQLILYLELEITYHQFNFTFKSFFDSEVLGIILERMNRSLLMEKPNSKMHNGLFTESGLYQFIGTVLDSIINPKNTNRVLKEQK